MIEAAQNKMDKMQGRVEYMMKKNQQMQGVVIKASRRLIDAKQSLDEEAALIAAQS